MCASNIRGEEQLLRFAQEYGGDRLRLEPLEFWGRHANARFSARAVCFAVDWKRRDVEQALRELVAAGLLESAVENGLTFYSLTTHEDKRGPVMELGSLPWHMS